MTERELPENIGLPDKNLELIKQPNEIKKNKLGGIDNFLNGSSGCFSGEIFWNGYGTRN